MIVCPTCGKENEDFFRFCLGCGEDISSVEPTPEEPPARRRKGTPARVAAATVVEAGASTAAARPAGPGRGDGDTDLVGSDVDEVGVADEVEVTAAEVSVADAAESTVPEVSVADGVEGTVPEVGAELPGPSEPQADPAEVGLGARATGDDEEEAPTRLYMDAAELTGGASRPTSAGKLAHGERERAATAETPAIADDSVLDDLAGPAAELDLSDLAPPPQPSDAESRHGGAEPPVTALDTSDVILELSELEAGGPCPSCGAKTTPEQAFCANCGGDLHQLRMATAERRGPSPVVAPQGRPRGRLVLIQEDGSDGTPFTLHEDLTVLGRTGGNMAFPEDDFLATRHAEFSYREGELYVQPLDTTNGLYLRIGPDTELVSGSLFRVGQELLRFDLIKDIAGSQQRDSAGTLGLGSPLLRDTWGRLAQVVSPRSLGVVHLLASDETYIGRDRGDVTFPDDGYVSGSHALITRRGGRVFLRDLGSSNGTYLRIVRPHRLQRYDYVLAGQQLLRVEP